MGNIVKKDISESLKDSYAEYSISVIKSRALPDVRDGLKPVHRRILYSMKDLGITSRSPYKKSARITGDTIGKYHPHGDSAVYSALVRLAQSFNMRYPLIDGQGNFGTLDDEPAAQRYTEARFTKLAEEMLYDIDKNSVDFKPNYDDSLEEPVVLPSRIPNILLNGTSGIAVGMSTNIPPHNLNELMDALIYFIDNPQCSIDDLLQFVKGPDFPSGGVLYGKEDIENIYRGGRSSLKLGSKYHIEEDDSGHKIIVIDELPFQVSVNKVITEISNLVKNKIIEEIIQVQDESDKEIPTRLTIKLKIGENPKIIVNKLFKMTNLLITYSSNMLCIVDEQPRVLNLKEILHYFLHHRKTVIIRKFLFELDKINSRIHLLEGIKKAIDMIDETIKVIRSSNNSREIKDRLKELLNIDETQSQAILDLKLQKLSGFEIEKIIEETNNLIDERNFINKILSNSKELDNYIKEEFREIKDKYYSKRKTLIVNKSISYNEEDFINDEPVYILKTENQYINMIRKSTIPEQNRGGKGKNLMSLNEDDFINDIIEANLLDEILFVTNKGKGYKIKAYKLPESKKGKALINFLNLDKDEKVISIIKLTDQYRYGIFTSKYGQIIKIDSNTLLKIRASGSTIVGIKEYDEIVSLQLVKDMDDAIINIVTYSGQITRFPLKEVREVQSRRSTGVKGIKLKDNDYVTSSIVRSRSENYNLIVITEKGFGKKTLIEEYRITHRGKSGVKVSNVNEKSGKIVSILDEDKEHDIVIITKNGKIIKVDTNSIRPTSRVTLGVKIIKLENSDKVIKAIKSIKEVDSDG